MSDIIIENPQQKIVELVKLLIECRDALPAITIDRAKCYDVSLTLADRIEDALEPWEVKDDTQNKSN